MYTLRLRAELKSKYFLEQVSFTLKSQNTKALPFLTKSDSNISWSFFCLILTCLAQCITIIVHHHFGVDVSN